MDEHGSRLLTEPPKNGFSPPTNSSGRGLKTVGVGAIRGGVFSPISCTKFADVSAEKVSHFFVKKNDVFVVRGNGNRRLAGQAGLAIESIEEMFYPDLLIRLRFDLDKISPALATALWNSPSTHTRLISRAKSTNGIWKINGKDVREHSLAVPPADEASSACEMIQGLDSRIDAALQRVVAARGFMQSTLGALMGTSS